MMRVLPFAVVALLVAVIGQTGLAARFGAHPWWAAQVVWIGGVLGIACAAIAVALGRAGRRIAVVAVVVGGLGLVIAGWGKSRFAASFAEDALAGQMWYFGWIVAMAGIAAALVLGLGLGLSAIRRASNPATRR